MADPLVVERRIDAPPWRVYQFLTDGEKWSRWQGASAEVDARKGGLFGILMGNGMRARGQFVELEQDRRVVFTWGWVGHPGVPPGSSTVEIDLVPEGSGTLLRLTHHGLPPDELATHRQGWEHYLPRLATVAGGGDPGPDPGV